MQTLRLLILTIIASATLLHGETSGKALGAHLAGSNARISNLHRQVGAKASADQDNFAYSLVLLIA